ncbi:MAG: hypothetical protein DMG13_20720 [Acidobacteria bacterium]|nr:MAG: hypothetical protein DMG13_20720 [Acidobacteriota bacterium]
MDKQKRPTATATIPARNVLLMLLLTRIKSPPQKLNGGPDIGFVQDFVRIARADMTIAITFLSK